jgi:hypothetical protein
MVHAVQATGATATAISSVLGQAFLGVNGTLSGEAPVDAFIAAHPAAENNTARWYFDEPILEGDHPCVVSKMWGRNTEAALDGPMALVPGAGVSYAPA